MVVKKHIETLKNEEQYEEIKKYINNYKRLKEEFIEVNSFSIKGWWWMICFCSSIIIFGLFQGLEKTIWWIKGLYIIPFLFISIKTFSSYIKMNEAEYNNSKAYKAYRKDVVLKSIYISSFIIYFIPVLVYLFGFEFTNKNAIKLFCAIGIIVSGLLAIFYKIREKRLIKIYSEKKLIKLKMSNELNKALCGLGATMGIMYTRKYGAGVWMLIGIVGVAILSLKGLINMYCDYKMIDFMEEEIYSYLPDTKKSER